MQLDVFSPRNSALGLSPRGLAETGSPTPLIATSSAAALHKSNRVMIPPSSAPASLNAGLADRAAVLVDGGHELATSRGSDRRYAWLRSSAGLSVHSIRTFLLGY